MLPQGLYRVVMQGNDKIESATIARIGAKRNATPLQSDTATFLNL